MIESRSSSDKFYRSDPAISFWKEACINSISNSSKTNDAETFKMNISANIALEDILMIL